MYVQQFLFVSHSYFIHRDDALGGYLPPVPPDGWFPPSACAEADPAADAQAPEPAPRDASTRTPGC